VRVLVLVVRLVQLVGSSRWYITAATTATAAAPSFAVAITATSVLCSWTRLGAGVGV
jgi:hypothetical protein